MRVLWIPRRVFGRLNLSWCRSVLAPFGIAPTLCRSTLSQVKVSCLLPDHYEQLCRLAGATITYRLDVWSGYWQIKIIPEYRAKAAFVTIMGLFQPIEMMFGVCTGPPTYQTYMNTTFKRDMKPDVCTKYIDDIAGGGNSDQSHLLRKRALATCRRSKILRKSKKCKIRHGRMKHLERLLEADTVSLDPASVTAVHTFPENLERKIKVQSLLKLARWCREYVPH